MANVASLPCDGDGVCMVCKQKPTQEQTLTCKTCTTPWHSTCLSSSAPQTLGEIIQWDCPDCAVPEGDVPAVVVAVSGEGGSLVAAIREIEADKTLTELEKAKKRQKLLSNGKVEDEDGEDDESGPSNKKQKGEDYHVLDDLAANFNCSFCMKLPERPVTTPCGHNFCLKCFQKWIGQGKRSCAKCRTAIPTKMASQPRINSSLVVAIRMAKLSKSSSSVVQEKVYHFVHNQDRPNKAYTTERAKKTGKANACSGKIFVTVALDHFGPILAENDPQRNRGLLVGDCWEDRMECRQWGAHFPHVAGIAGQSDYGAQSVALSGGYEDDEDHGEWFLYTGSGGRDLSGNKRTNKSQSFDQKFDKSNEALRVSCKKGYPVRVVRDHISITSYKVGKGDRVRFWEDIWIGDRALCEDFVDFYGMSNRKNHPIRDFVIVENGVASWDIDLRQLFNDWEIDALATFLSRLGTPPLFNQEEDKLIQTHTTNRCFTVEPWSHKEKRSSYAPETGVRYDGVYRIEKCWRKVGIQGFKVCRYLFVRCDNEPAPWTSDDHGDRPRHLPAIAELKGATDITERREEPSWDYDDKDNCWKWMKQPPVSRKAVDAANPEDRKRARKAIKQAQNLSVREKLLKEFSCLICRKVLNLPVTTPCAHNFCKPCLEGAFSGKTLVRERFCASERSLRVKKNTMKCPACVNDIADFLKDVQVNRELMGVIESLQHKTDEENAKNFVGGESAGADGNSETLGEDAESKAVQNSPEGKSKVVYKRRKMKEEPLSSKPSDSSTENVKQSPESGVEVVGSMQDDQITVDNTTYESVGEPKAEGAVTTEGNNSPSSPLHVRSDGDE